MCRCYVDTKVILLLQTLIAFFKIITILNWKNDMNKIKSIEYVKINRLIIYSKITVCFNNIVQWLHCILHRGYFTVISGQTLGHFFSRTCRQIKYQRDGQKSKRIIFMNICNSLLMSMTICNCVHIRIYVLERIATKRVC